MKGLPWKIRQEFTYCPGMYFRDLQKEFQGYFEVDSKTNFPLLIPTTFRVIAGLNHA